MPSYTKRASCAPARMTRADDYTRKGDQRRDRHLIALIDSTHHLHKRPRENLMRDKCTEMGPNRAPQGMIGRPEKSCILVDLAGFNNRQVFFFNGGYRCL